MKVKLMKLKIVKTYNNTISFKCGLVCCGDVHLYNNLPFSEYNDEKISSRLLEIEKILFDAVDCAASIKKPFFINGDLITGRRLGYPVLNSLVKFRERIEHKKVFTIINLGNHDLDGKVTMLEPLFESCKYITLVVNAERIVLNNGLVLVAIPYGPLSAIKKSLSKFAKIISEDQKCKILGVHLAFKGALLAGARSEAGLMQKIFRKNGVIGKHFDLIIGSHFHKFQYIAGKHGFYTGSLLPIDFGEQEKEHGYHVLDFDHKIHYFICPPYIPQFKQISVKDIDDFNDAKNNYVKIKIDKKKFSLQKEKSIRKMLLKKGARAVVFDKIGDFEIKSKITMADDMTVEQIVAKFAEVKSQEENLEVNRFTTIGLDILHRAKEKRVLSARLSD